MAAYFSREISPRLGERLALASGGAPHAAYYHCSSRVVRRAYLYGLDSMGDHYFVKVHPAQF